MKILFEIGNREGDKLAAMKIETEDYIDPAELSEELSDYMFEYDWEENQSVANAISVLGTLAAEAHEFDEIAVDILSNIVSYNFFRATNRYDDTSTAIITGADRISVFEAIEGIVVIYLNAPFPEDQY